MAQITWYGVIIVSTLVFVDGSPYADAAMKGAPTVCSVKLDLNNYHETREECPDEVKAEVIVNNAKHTLSLTLSEAIHQRHEGRKTKDDTIPLIIGSNSSHTSIWASQKLMNSGKTCFYQDLARSAAVSIKFTDTGHEIFGSYTHGNQSKIILPSSESTNRLRRHNTKEKNDHIVYAMKPELPTNDGQESEKLKRLKRQSAGSNFYVEYYVVIDYSLYTRFHKSAQRLGTNVYDDIKFYYYHVVNRMDMMYGSINAGFRLHIRLASIRIVESAVESRWTEDTSLGHNRIDIGRALEEFKTWTASESIFSTYDHAALFTAKDCIGENNAEYTSGQAYIKSICTSDSVSINEDDGVISAASVAAHELGHCLGSKHDGENNRCNPKDQYIMTPLSEWNDSNFLVNSKRFSTCSVEVIADTVLNRVGAKCLKNNPSDLNLDGVNRNLKPGQKINIHEQCKILLGESTRFCATQREIQEFCGSLFCLSPEGKCSKFLGRQALDGTTCGNRKWCINGECVMDVNAPEADDSCVHGDAGYPVKGTQMCSQFVAENPAACYTEHNLGLCCGSCKEHYRANQPGCEYGDRGDCSKLTENPAACYTEYNLDLCCGSCKEQYRANQPGCEYGDRGDCSKLTESQCYYNEQRCCQTCIKFDTGDPACRYGDKVSDCKAESCQIGGSEYQSSCCRTCGLLQTTSSTTSKTTSRSTEPPTMPANVEATQSQASPKRAVNAHILIVVLVVAIAAA